MEGISSPPSPSIPLAWVPTHVHSTASPSSLTLYLPDVARAIELLEKLQESGDVPGHKLQSLKKVLQSEFCTAIREVSRCRGREPPVRERQHDSWLFPSFSSESLFSSFHDLSLARCVSAGLFQSIIEPRLGCFFPWSCCWWSCRSFTCSVTFAVLFILRNSILFFCCFHSKNKPGEQSWKITWKSGTVCSQCVGKTLNLII